MTANDFFGSTLDRPVANRYLSPEGDSLLMSSSFQEMDLLTSPKPVVFILHSFLATKVYRLGLYA
jgi:hypothetical protein